MANIQVGRSTILELLAFFSAFKLMLAQIYILLSIDVRNACLVPIYTTSWH